MYRLKFTIESKLESKQVGPWQTAGRRVPDLVKQV